MKTSLYRTRLRHYRRAQPSRSFAYDGYLWSFDLAGPPRLPWIMRPLASVKARDHVGDPNLPIRANIDALLAGRDIDLAGGRVQMLTGARVFGYVFNPLTLFWCYHATGDLACVVAEVHNTYGQRHAYVLTTDSSGRTETDKEFYVSPFLPLTGSYCMSLPPPAKRLSVSVTLHDRDQSLFVATLRGVRQPATIAAVLRLALRFPFAPLMTTARIRFQGILLWLCGVPIQPRPAVPSEKHQESHGED